MKAFRILALVLCVLLCAMAMIACDGGDDPKPCEDHVDDDRNGICDICSAEVDVPCTEHTDKNNDRFCDNCNELIPETKYTVTVTVKDENEAPLAGISVALRKNDSAVLTATTDANGCISGQLVAGNYMLVVEGLPEYWYATGNYSTVQVNATSTAFSVTAVNNTPDGSVEKPFPAENAETGEVAVNELPVGATYWYTTKGESRYLVITNSGIKVTYNGNEYTPDPNGVVRVLLDSSDTNENTMFAVTNTSGSANTVTVGFAALPGTLNNPFAAILGNEHSATVVAGTSVYYTVTATESGWLVIHSPTATNDITLFNTTTSIVANSTNGGKTAMIYVTTGDVVRITVSSTIEAPAEGSQTVDTVRFTAYICTGSASDPILFWDGCDMPLEAGATLHFMYMGEEGNLMIRTRDGSFYWNDGSEAVSTVNGILTPANTAFSVTNAGGKCEISFAVYPEE